VRSVLHEAVHAATLSALHDPQTVAEREAGEYLRSLYEYAKNQIDDTHYGLDSVEEFIAEAFSNPGFQAALAKIKLPGESKYSVWDAFKAAIMKLLGVAKNNTLLSEVLLTGTEVFSSRTTGGRARVSEYQDQGPPASNAKANAVPSSAIVGIKNNARAFMAYPKKNANDVWTLYPVTPGGDPRGDPAGKISNLTRAQAEQYIKTAGSTVIPPASDTSIVAG
jgi:hypothetical protein